MAYTDYGYADDSTCRMQRLLAPVVERLLGPMPRGSRILDIGCGNGALASHFLAKGINVVGIDLSDSGVAIARTRYPQGRFEVLPADGGLLAVLGCTPFDFVVSTEVIEHLYDPRA